MPANALKELCFVPASMASVGSTRDVVPSTLVLLQAAGSKRSLSLHLPVIVRAINQRIAGSSWESLCAVLRKHGIPLCSSASELEDVAAASVPARFGRRLSNEGLNARDLNCADAFDLDCRQYDSTRWTWPAEAETATKFEAFVTAVRSAAGGDTPIGVTLPIGAHEDDLKKCLDAGVDYLTLVSSRTDTVDDLAVSGIVAARRACTAHGSAELPLIVELPVADANDILVCIALGGTVISIDHILSRYLDVDSPKTTTTAGGMLRGITSTSAQQRATLSDVDDALLGIRQQMERQMSLCGAIDLHQMNSTCRRLNADSATIIESDSC